MSSVSELERQAFEDLNAISREAVCHSLDAQRRTLCGAELTGTKAPHPIGECVVDGHKRCATCGSLIEAEEGVGPEMEAA
jgi:hypothetical protein